LRDNARRVGGYLNEGLQELATRHPAIGDIRGMGLMVAVELVRGRQTKEPAPETTGRVRDGAKRRGSIVGRGGRHANVLRLCPPLIMRETDVDAAIDILDEAFAAAAA
jgi:alanine-glyoxylate transaminase / (R)-3-amino-2-methylpropionate-pyruvate transaminase